MIIEIMSWIELTNLVLGIIGVAFGVPAMIIQIITLIKNKYRLDTEFIVAQYQSLLDDRKQPTDEITAYGNFHFVNYSNSAFNIVKIVATYDSQKYLIKTLNTEQDRISQTLFRYIPLEHFPIFPRASGDEPFYAIIPDNLKDKEIKLKVYTSHRRRPYKGIMKPQSRNTIDTKQST